VVAEAGEDPSEQEAQRAEGLGGCVCHGGSASVLARRRALRGEY
jgi:hypothetical protein